MSVVVEFNSEIQQRSCTELQRETTPKESDRHLILPGMNMFLNIYSHIVQVSFYTLLAECNCPDLFDLN